MRKFLIPILIVIAFGSATAGLLSHAVVGYAGYKIGQSQPAQNVIQINRSAKADTAGYCGSDSEFIVISLSYNNYESAFFDQSCGKVVVRLPPSGCEDTKYLYMSPVEYLKMIHPELIITGCKYAIASDRTTITTTATKKERK